MNNCWNSQGGGAFMTEVSGGSTCKLGVVSLWKVPMISTMFCFKYEQEQPKRVGAL